MLKPQGYRREFMIEAVLALAVPASFILSLLIGRYGIPVETLCKMLFSTVFPLEKTWPQTMETVFFQIRLPRITAAFFVGASLSVSGAIFQGIFKILLFRLISWGCPTALASARHSLSC